MACWGVPTEINIDASVKDHDGGRMKAYIQAWRVDATNMALSESLRLFIHSLICIYQHRVVRSAIGVTIKMKRNIGDGKHNVHRFRPMDGPTIF